MFKKPFPSLASPQTGFTDWEMMPKLKPTYTELKAENAQLQQRVTELEDLVRGLTQQMAEILRASGGQRAPPLSNRGPEGPSRPIPQ